MAKAAILLFSLLALFNLSYASAHEPGQERIVSKGDWVLFGLNPLMFGSDGVHRCGLPENSPPGAEAKPVEEKLYKVQQLLDSSLGAAVFFDMPLTEALRTRLNEAANNSENEDWCALFAVAMARSIDQRVPGPSSELLKDRLGNLQSALKLQTRYARKGSLSFIPPTERPEPGCLAIFRDVDSPKGHVAIVLSADATHMKTVDGNVRVNPMKDGCAPNHRILVENRLWHDEKKNSPASIEEITNTDKVCDPNGNGSSRGHTKIYAGCIRPWPPAPGEEKQWKKGLQALERRYQAIQGYEFLRHDSQGKLVYERDSRDGQMKPVRAWVPPDQVFGSCTVHDLNGIPGVSKPLPSSAQTCDFEECMWNRIYEYSTYLPESVRKAAGIADP